VKLIHGHHMIRCCNNRPRLQWKRYIAVKIFGVSFTYLLISPLWANLHEILREGSTSRRNQLCQILSQSDHGFWFCGVQFLLSHGKEKSRFNTWLELPFRLWLELHLWYRVPLYRQCTIVHSLQYRKLLCANCIARHWLRGTMPTEGALLVTDKNNL